MGWKLFGVAVSLMVANFLYQALGGQNWSLAIDRSWFQASAVYITGLCLWLSSKDGTGGAA